MSKSVVMDAGLHFLELVNQAQALASGRMRFVTIPVTAVGARNDRGQSIITVDVPAVHEYVASLVSGKPQAPPPPATPTPTAPSSPARRCWTSAPRATARPCPASTDRSSR